jgi:hypothetical protein
VWIDEIWDMRWDEIWDEMRWDEMRWDEMRWDEMRWDDIIKMNDFVFKRIKKKPGEPFKITLVARPTSLGCLPVMRATREGEHNGVV